MNSIWADRSRRDRGETSAEVVLVLPVLLLLVLVVVQSSLYFHTAHVARAAAAEGAMAAASHLVPGPSTVSTGTERAAVFAEEAGGRIVGAPRAEISDGMVRVRVTLEVPALIPFWSTRVSRDASEPKERVLTELER